MLRRPRRRRDQDRGARARATTTATARSPQGQTSLSFQNNNRGKRSHHARRAQARGPRAVARGSSSGADALVENFRAGWLAHSAASARACCRRATRGSSSRRSRASGDGPARWRAELRHRRAGERRPALDDGLRRRPPSSRAAAHARTSSAASISRSASWSRCSSASARASRACSISRIRIAIFAITDSAATIYAGIGAKMERVGNAAPVHRSLRLLRDERRPRRGRNCQQQAVPQAVRRHRPARARPRRALPEATAGARANRPALNADPQRPGWARERATKRSRCSARADADVPAARSLLRPTS